MTADTIFSSCSAMLFVSRPQKNLNAETVDFTVTLAVYNVPLVNNPFLQTCLSTWRLSLIEHLQLRLPFSPK